MTMAYKQQQRAMMTMIWVFFLILYKSTCRRGEKIFLFVVSNVNFLTLYHEAQDSERRAELRFEKSGTLEILAKLPAPPLHIESSRHTNVCANERRWKSSWTRKSCTIKKTWEHEWVWKSSKLSYNFFSVKFPLNLLLFSSDDDNLSPTFVYAH